MSQPRRSYDNSLVSRSAHQRWRSFLEMPRSSATLYTVLSPRPLRRWRVRYPTYLIVTKAAHFTSSQYTSRLLATGSRISVDGRG